MTEWKSTLGAPIPEPNAQAIADRWQELYHLSLAVPANPEPLEMLEFCTEVYMAVWEVRHTIDEAWFQANKRLKPRLVHSAKPQPKLVLTDDMLKELGLK